MTTQRYPLAWPIGWKRTAPGRRQRARFHGTSMRKGFGDSTYKVKEPLTLAESLGRLYGEMHRLGVRDQDWLISSDLRVRLDGLPYANQAQPAEPGVAVYFRLKSADRVLACDVWTRIPDNVAAIAAHIECIRGIDRYGVGTLEQAFAGYAALPAKGATWRTTLGFAPDQVVTPAMVDDAFRQRAREAHPDTVNGSHDAMASLSQAREEARHELRDR